MPLLTPPACIVARLSWAMRIALAQILAGTDPAANLSLVEDYTRRAAEAGARLVVFPEGNDVPVRGAAGSGRRSHRRAVGRRCARHRRTRRASPWWPACSPRRPTAGSPTRCSPPGPTSTPTTTRSTSTTRSASPNPTRSRRADEPVVITVDGVGVGLTLCYDIRFPEPLHRAGRPRRPADHRAAPRGAPDRASWSSGRCWRGPGRWTPRVSSPRSDRAIPATTSPSPPRRRPASAAAWWPPRSARWWPRRAPIPQLLVADVDIDRVPSVRETLAVLRNRSEFAQIDKAESRG